MTAISDFQADPAFTEDPVDRVLELLQRRVALKTESQSATCRQVNEEYLNDISRQLQPLGFEVAQYENPESADHPLLIATRREAESSPTVLLYGHGDVQFAQTDQWDESLDPWRLEVRDGKIYGRGTADNKGQHTVNLVALESALLRLAEDQGESVSSARLGFNLTLLMETAEEVGSTGLREFAERHASTLSADLFIGSDGPRFTANVPTIFLGSRGSLNVRLDCSERKGAHHSGNWGGKLRNPATVIAAAIATLVDGNGRILVDELRPPELPEAVRKAINNLPAESEASDDPAVDSCWGEPGLSPNERALGFNTLEVLTLEAGTPKTPVNAIPGSASALVQLRYIVGTDADNIIPAIQRALKKAGIRNVDVRAEGGMSATRLSPDHPAVVAAAEAITRTTGKTPAVMPNLGGTIPNSVFSDTLNLPTVWIPHSYPGCNQHAPNEHALLSILSEGFEIMQSIFLSIGEHPDRWIVSSGKRTPGSQGA
ncbi:M20/M25/M40 family metallo-hydrolase [Brevibacterium luteolum]|uniref:M20/M25/M40 family metallo-hydrolase n=1 Tax=Brevibacterium luteolum TaxID=199591 RepID=UPI001C24FE65|nr:M20/M25/M40 family metallo-hydrolase [Brevibacterium luteolum]